MSVLDEQKLEFNHLDCIDQTEGHIWLNNFQKKKKKIHRINLFSIADFSQNEIECFNVAEHSE